MLFSTATKYYLVLFYKLCELKVKKVTEEPL